MIHAAECNAISNRADGTGSVVRFGLLQGNTFVPVIGQVLWKHTTAGARRRMVQMHEFGHALGLWHTFTAVPSIMSYNPFGYSTDITAFDRVASGLMYQRPPGNRNPDADPTWFVMNPALAEIRLSTLTEMTGRACPGPPSHR